MVRLANSLTLDDNAPLDGTLQRMASDAAAGRVPPFAASPVDAALLGQDGDWGGLVGGVAGGPTVLGGCRRDGIDLSVDGEVVVQVLDFHLPRSRGHLIGHGCLVTGNLEDKRKWTSR